MAPPSPRPSKGHPSPAGGNNGDGGGYINLNRSPLLYTPTQATTPRRLPDALPIPTATQSIPMENIHHSDTQRRSSSSSASPVGAGPSAYRQDKDKRKVRTSAEAYAHAQSLPRRTNGKTDLSSFGNGIASSSGPSSRHHRQQPAAPPVQVEKERGNTTKPIFDWISRKLGTARRATISDIGSSTKLTIPPRLKIPPTTTTTTTTHPHQGRGKAGVVDTSPSSPVHINRRHSRSRSRSRQLDPLTLRRDLSRAESQSIVSFSMRTANTMEREANNPYPSIPILSGGGRARADDQTTMSMSLSYVSRGSRSRSRSSSLRHDNDDDDGEDQDQDQDGENQVGLRVETRRRRSFDGTSTTTSHRKRLLENAADDDASLRPFPPSHPGSPTPSTSFRTRSRSASLLSPPHVSTHGHGGATRAMTVYSTSSGVDERSLVSSEDRAFGEGDSRRGDQVRDGTGEHSDYDNEDNDDEVDSERRRQSRQDSTSTKPTTCISFDSSGEIAHIAQVPSTPITLHTPILGNTVTVVSSPATPAAVNPPFRPCFSIATTTTTETPNTPVTSLFSSTPTSPASPNSAALPSHPLLSLTQAPKHSAPHPIHNPHPSSPPDPNASTLTLASSTFALIPPPAPPSTIGGTSYTSPPSIHRLRDVSGGANARPTSLVTSPSITWAPTPDAVGGDHRPGSMHEPNGSIHHLSMGPPSLSMSWRGQWVGGRGGVADRDASVRALRRQGSWESYESGWSWRGLGAPVPVPVAEGFRNSMISPIGWTAGGEQDGQLIMSSGTSQRSLYKESHLATATTKGEVEDEDEIGSGGGAGSRIESPVGVAIAA
ncbi:hypothetical protein CI109_100319 [Kwoniella shandongensis]|uniref:Uncharacterized protein n=1 Tax=Kwoniella shandongensis TaxID=1734106 RepID=A0AAJ8MTU8_9TREE